MSSDIEALKANIATNSVVAEEVPALPKNIDVEDELDDLLILLAKIKPQEVELPEERPENLFDVLQMRKVLKPYQQKLVKVNLTIQRAMQNAAEQEAIRQSQ